jgi:hypothetical protein
MGSRSHIIDERRQKTEPIVQAKVSRDFLEAKGRTFEITEE